jgi:hypothetical protein
MLTIRVRGVKELKAGLNKLRHQIPMGMLETLGLAANEIKREMFRAGKKPTYPIQWDSTKQRKAFFATDGFGGGIPHKRTQNTQLGWRVIKFENGFNVGNPLSHAVYVYGSTKSAKRQSRIHKGRWPLFARTWPGIIEKLPRNIQARLKIIITGAGFKING